MPGASLCVPGPPRPPDSLGRPPVAVPAAPPPPPIVTGARALAVRPPAASLAIQPYRGPAPGLGPSRWVFVKRFEEIDDAAVRPKPYRVRAHPSLAEQLARFVSEVYGAAAADRALVNELGRRAVFQETRFEDLAGGASDAELYTAPEDAPRPDDGERCARGERRWILLRPLDAPWTEPRALAATASSPAAGLAGLILGAAAAHFGGAYARVVTESGRDALVDSILLDHLCDADGSAELFVAR